MTTLYKHQQAAIAKGKLGNLALFHDCGTGKTLTAIRLIQYAKSRGKTPALVICPLSIIDAAWLTDVAKFAPELDAISLWSKKPSERKQRLAEDHDIYIANFETFKGLFDEIAAKEFKMLFVDESSKMKKPTTAITRALLALAGVQMRGKKGKKYDASKPIQHRYVMSGTPAPNDKSEYWAQIKFITGPGGYVFNDNFYAFRGRYFNKIPLGRTGQNIFKFKKYIDQAGPGGMMLQIDAAKEFASRMRPICDVVSKADALDLPDQVHEIRDVILSDPERLAYDTLKKDLVLRFASETILASNALVEVMKLRQLSSGFCYGAEGTHVTGTSKLKELLSLLEEIGDHQVIIWCNFRYEIRMLLDKLGSSDALWSETPDRDEVIRNFQSGRIRYLVANPQSAAHGLTFVNCNYAVYFSMNYSYELQKQSEDRIHRIGQDSKCTYYFLIAKDTVDRMIYRTVCKKGDMSKQVLEYLKGEK